MNQRIKNYLLDIRAVSDKCEHVNRPDHTIYGIEFVIDNGDTIFYNITCNKWVGEVRFCYEHDHLIQCALNAFGVGFDELEDAVKEQCRQDNNHNV